LMTYQVDPQMKVGIRNKMVLDNRIKKFPLKILPQRMIS